MMDVRSVSIISEITQTSSNSSRDFGNMIVQILMIFSCLRSLSNLSSLRVLLANILCSNALSIFLMATSYLLLSLAYLSLAATTIPYAPCPTKLYARITDINNLISPIYLELLFGNHCSFPIGIRISILLIHIYDILSQLSAHFFSTILPKMQKL